MSEKTRFITIQKGEPPTEAEAREASATTTSPERLTELALKSQALAKLVVQNPSAPSALLEKLSAHGPWVPRMFNPPPYSLRPTPWTDPNHYEWTADKETRREISKNPNTPPRTLLTLACHFPQEVSQNPALSLAFLEEPNALYQMDLTALVLMLATPQFSHWAPQVAKHFSPKTKETLRRAPETPQSLREYLAEIEKTPET